MSYSAPIDSAAAADRLLGALAEQLAAGGHAYDLVVIGGSALLALGLVARSTQDIDVVALGRDNGFDEALPLPAPLTDARDRVARDFGLPSDWLNSQVAADMLRLGLPRGFADRLTTRHFGLSLTVRYASRVDQIHFKLHAAVDQGGGKHLADLLALDPASEELVAAARWARTHDPSEGFLELLTQALTHLGVANAKVEVGDADLSA
jgi:hypothetical protein